MSHIVFRNHLGALLDHLRLLGPLRRLRNGLRLARRVWRAKRNYARVLKRIRAKPTDEKIRVLFLCGEPAKWKCQKLYEAMRDSGVFEPVVGLTAWNGQSEKIIPSDDDLDAFHRKAEAFFDSLGDSHVRTYALHPRRGLDLAGFSPDIVFYSEPWAPIENQLSEPVSAFALAFFIPYFTPSHGDVKWESRQPLHRFLYAYVTLNEYWARTFRKGLRPWSHSARFLGLGHPALDFFLRRSADSSRGKCVIYAPHYSFPGPATGNRGYVYPFSTFDSTGAAILAYAQAHPEFNWVFKPHPLLRGHLVRSGFGRKSKPTPISPPGNGSDGCATTGTTRRSSCRRGP